MKIHNFSCNGEMTLTCQSHVPKSSVVKDGNFMSGLADISGETVTKKLKLGHLHVSKEDKSVLVSTTLIASKRGDLAVLKDVINGKSVDLHNIPNMMVESEGIIAGDSRKRKGCSGDEITGNTGEVVDAGLQTSKSPKVTEAIEDVSNSSTDKKYQCKLCLSVLKNRLLFWQHLHEHSQEVPYTCKNCLEIFDKEKVLKIHYKHRCGCAACGKKIRGSHAGHHAKGCRLGNPFLCTGCSNRFPSSDIFREHLRSHIDKENSYICKECGEIFLDKSDARKHEFLKKNCSNPVIQAFTSEADIIKFDFPDEEREEVMPLSPVNIESEFNSSALDPSAIDKEDPSTLDSLAIDKEEPLCGGRKSVTDIAFTIDEQESNFTEKTDELDCNCSCPFNHDESKVECMEHMECRTHAQCEKCPEVFGDKEMGDDRMKIHSSPGYKEMVSTGQNQVSKSSAVKDGDFISGHADISGETVSKKVRLGNIHASEEKSVPVRTTLIAPKTGDPPALKHLIISEKGLDMRSIPDVMGESKGMIAGGFKKSEITVNTSESIDTGLQTSKSPTGIEAMKDNSSLKDNGNISINRKYKCTLCFSVLRNRLLFWQHLQRHSKEVPYTCKNCVKVFDNEKTLKIHHKHRCCCVACGKLIRGISGALHAKGCRVGNPFTCRGCNKRFPSSDIFRDHLRCHSREKSYMCTMCRVIFLSKADADQHKIDKHLCLNPVVKAFSSDVDFFKFDVAQYVEVRSHVPDEERDKVIQMSSAKLESEFNSSALDTLSVVKEEPFYGGGKSINDTAGTVDVQESNFIEKTGEIDNFSRSFIDKYCDESNVESMEHMDHNYTQCEKRPEMLSHEEKRDDLMKIHSSSGYREMISTGQIKVPKSAEKVGDFKSDHADSSGERVSEKLKLGHLHASEEKSEPVSSALIAPKTAGRLRLEELTVGEKGVDLHNILNGSCVQGTVAGGSEKATVYPESENVMNTSEVHDTNLQTLNSQKGTEMVSGIISVYRKHECKLCFNVFKNKLLFCQHLRKHSEEVPYTCKNCVEIFDENSWEIHDCNCVVCGEQIQGRYIGIFPRSCLIGNPFTCIDCDKRFPSYDTLNDHMKSHSEDDLGPRKRIHRNKSLDSVVIVFLNEDEDEEDFLKFDITESAENPSTIPDEETNEIMPMSSVNLEIDFNSSSLDSLSFFKKELLYKGVDVGEINFSMKPNEIDGFNCSLYNNHVESKVDWIERMECHTNVQCEVCQEMLCDKEHCLEMYCDKVKKDDHMKIHSSPCIGEVVLNSQSQVPKSSAVKDESFLSNHIDTSGDSTSRKLKLGHLQVSDGNSLRAPKTVGPPSMKDSILGVKSVDLDNRPIVQEELLYGRIDLQKRNVIIKTDDNNEVEKEVEYFELVECHADAQCEICLKMFCSQEKCLEMICDKERDDHFKIHSPSCNKGLVWTGQSQIPNSHADKDGDFKSDHVDISGERVSEKLKLGHLHVSKEKPVPVSSALIAPKTAGRLRLEELTVGEKGVDLHNILNGSCVQRTVAGGSEKATVYPESENVVNTSEVHDTNLQTLNSQKGTEMVSGIISVNRKHECKLCFNVFKNKLLFCQHLRKHSEEVPYTCKNCVEIFDENSWEIHDCNCVVCGEQIQGRYIGIFPRSCLIGNPFMCIDCDKRFPSYDTLNDHMKSHSEDDLGPRKRIHRNKSLDSVVIVFLNEDEDEEDFLKFDITESAENPSTVPDEETNEIMPMSSVNLEIDFNSSSLDSLSFVKKELLYKGVDVGEINFSTKPNEIDGFNCSLYNNHVESEVDWIEHMECPTNVQCEVCQEMLCDKEHCLEMFCDKVKKDDHMKIHSSPRIGEVVLNSQSQVLKSSAVKDESFLSNLIDTSGDSTSRKLKLGHLQVSDGNSLRAPKTVGPPSMKDSILGVKSVDLDNRPIDIDFLQRTVPGDEVLPMCSINHESDFDFSGLDSLSLVQEELLYGRIDLQKRNVIIKTDDNSEAEKEVGYIELMESHADAQCEICLEMFCSQEKCLEMICDKERDDHFKIHSPSCNKALVWTDQSQIPNSPADIDGDFKSDHVDISGERVSEKLKLGHLHVSKEKPVPVSSALIAPKTAGRLRLEELTVGEKGVDLHNIPNGSCVQGTVAGGSEKATVYPESENVVNTSEVYDTNLQTLNSQKGTEMVSGIISVYRKHECKLCFNVFKNKLLFWQHLRKHSEEVPYTCKNCVEIFDDKNSWKIHDCNCVVCGEQIQGRYISIHPSSCLIGNPFTCIDCDKRFPSYDTLNDHMKSHSEDDLESQKRIHRNKSLDSVFIVFLNEDEDEDDFLKFDITESAENPSTIPDEETNKITPMSSVNLEIDFNSSSLDSLPFVRKELLYKGVDVGEINFSMKPNEIDGFNCSLYNSHVEGEGDCIEHMECHTYAQCEACQEMVCDKEHCLEMFCDKVKKDDHMKIHSSPCIGEIVLTDQSQVQKPSAVMDEDFTSDHMGIDIFGETASEKLKLGHLHISDGNSLIAPEPVGPQSLKDLIQGEKSISQHNTPNVIGFLQGTVATTRKYECNLCFSMLRNKLLFWQHLNMHCDEVPSTCKNCAEVFDDEESLKTHYSHKCDCAACGKLLQGIYASIHFKHCCIGNPHACICCAKRLPSSDVLRDHLSSFQR